jgi:predicted ATP-dependent serine protease
MASEDYVCLNIECRYHSSQPFPVCPQCGHRNTFVTQSNMRVRGCLGGSLSVAVGCFLLLIAVFVSVVVANQRTALRVNEVTALVLLYGLGAVFLIGGISLAIGGGRWFIRSLVSFGRRGGSGRV